MEVLQQLRDRAASAIDQARQTAGVRRSIQYIRRFADVLDSLTSLRDHDLPIRGIIGRRQIAATLARSAIERKDPTFVLYWEPHPERSEISKSDLQTIKGLGDFLRSRRVEPHFRVVFADATGASKQIVNFTYFRSVRESFERAFGSRVSFERQTDLYAARELSAFPAPLDLSAAIKTDPMFAYWLRQCGGSEQAALRFAAQRRNEQEILRELLGARGVLLTFGHPLEQVLMPDIPMQIFIRSASPNGFQDSAPWQDLVSTASSPRRRRAA